MNDWPVKMFRFIYLKNALCGILLASFRELFGTTLSRTAAGTSIGI
jgi:hypothetical protein